MTNRDALGHHGAARRREEASGRTRVGPELRERGTGRAPLAEVLDRNSGALLERRRRDESAQTPQERVAQAISDFAGSMAFVWMHLAVVALWILVNVGGVPFVPPFDRTFVILATVASVEAIFLGTFILITQNRMAAMQEQRAELDLHISLIAEHELTRLATLVAQIAEKTGVDPAAIDGILEIQRDIRPEQVLEHLDEKNQVASAQPPPE